MLKQDFRRCAFGESLGDREERVTRDRFPRSGRVDVRGHKLEEYSSGSFSCPSCCRSLQGKAITIPFLTPVRPPRLIRKLSLGVENPAGLLADLSARAGAASNQQVPARRGEVVGTLRHFRQRRQPDVGYSAFRSGGRWVEVSSVEYVSMKGHM
jgi:hypothetical protein